MRRLILAAAVGVLGAVGAAFLFLASVHKGGLREEVWAPSWPRQDGSVRSYGEVWDHLDGADPAAG